MVPPIPTTTSDGFLLALDSHMRRKRQGHHLAVTVLELDGQPDLPAIHDAAERLGRNHPILHSRIHRHRRTFTTAWHPGSTKPIPVSDHNSHTRLPILVEQLLNSTTLDIRAPGPNLEIHILTPSPERWHLLLLWPHALFDGIGINKLITALAHPEPFAGTRTSTREGDAPSPGSLWQAAHPVIEEMRTFPAHRIRSLHQRRSKPGHSSFEVLAFDRTTTAAIGKHMAATAGELLLLPYFACCAARAVQAVIATRHPDEHPPVLLSIPVQRHARADQRPLFHNHMVAYSLLLTADELRELAPASKTLYRKYASFIRRKLPAAMDALMQLMDRCPSRFYLKPAAFYLKGEICTLFHSHTGTFAPGLTSLFGSRLLNGYHIPSVSSPPGIGIFFSEFDNQLTCTLSWKAGSLTSDELQTLKQTLLTDLGLQATQHPK